MKPFMIMFCALATAFLTGAAAAPSVERGRELFNSTSLGTNGKSCASCHKDGSGLDLATANNGADLAGIVNQCIRKPLKGKGLPDDSSDMKSLVMYLRALGSAAK
jgi:cytochrome c